MQSSYTEEIKSSMRNQETDYIIDILKSNSEFGTLKEFKDGLSELIRNKGYSDKEDPFKEAAFISGKLKEICPEPEKIITKESLNAWFSGKKVPECNVKGKRTMLSIAFALNMTVDEVETFFRKTFFGTPFNFRSAEDDIMYYCLKFGKTYEEAEKLISEYNAKISDVTEDNTQHTGVLKEKITIVNA